MNVMFSTVFCAVTVCTCLCVVCVCVCCVCVCVHACVLCVCVCARMCVVCVCVCTCLCVVCVYVVCVRAHACVCVCHLCSSRQWGYSMVSVVSEERACLRTIRAGSWQRSRRTNTSCSKQIITTTTTTNISVTLSMPSHTTHKYTVRK